MNRHLIAALLVLGASGPWAQQTVNHPGTTATTSQAEDFAEGEVRKVDKAAGKVTQAHRPPSSAGRSRSFPSIASASSVAMGRPRPAP